MSDNSLKAAAPYIAGAIGAILFGPIGGVAGLMVGRGMAADNDSSDSSGDHHLDDGTNLSTSDFLSDSDPQSFTDYFNF